MRSGTNRVAQGTKQPSDCTGVTTDINPFRAPAAPILELILVCTIGSVAGINESMDADSPWGDGHHRTQMGTIWVHFLLYPSRTTIFIGIYLVELVGIEPTTSSLRTMRSPS